MELKHFCLQYYEWVEEIKNIRLYGRAGMSEVKSSDLPDPTFDISQRLIVFELRMRMVEDACMMTDEALAPYLFEAVTKDLTFPYFEAKGAPFGRDLFYDRLHKFFYILSQIRM